MPKPTHVVFPMAAAKYFVTRMADIADDITSDDDSLNDHLAEAEDAVVDEIIKKFKLPLYLVEGFRANQGGWMIVPAKIRTTKGQVLVPIKDIEEAKENYGG